MSYHCYPPSVEKMTSLIVSNLNYSTTAKTVQRVFEKYGDIGDVYIPRDHFTKQPRGFGFVRFLEKHHAQVAKHALNGIVLDGHKLQVHMARNSPLPNPCSAYYRGTSSHRYKHQSRSLTWRHHYSSGSGRSRFRGRSRYSHQKPPCFYSRSPSISESRSTHRLKSKSSSAFRSRRLYKKKSSACNPRICPSFLKSYRAMLRSSVTEDWGLRMGGNLNSP